ncbi:MAG: hypothetical protein N2321_00990 [Melioribacteraceae bacterium]|nr:hypothetical protein [Melioribacteraceae bacterium]
MKNILLKIFVLLFVITACSSEPPSIRVLNRRTNKANVQIKTANNNTININDVGSNQTTPYQEIEEGYHKATATLQSESASPFIYFTTIKNRKYTIVVLDGAVPSLRIDDDGEK